jgi:hypothetical protein
MTPEAKKKLSATIRALRARLITELGDAMASEYRLALPRERAELAETPAARRAQIEAWVDEQVRALPTKARAAAAERFRAELVSSAAYTLLNRVLFLRLLESAGLRKVAVVTGGWGSAAASDFRALAPELVRDDPSEGYAFLLDLVFRDLSRDLPGLYGRQLGDLVPVPVGTLRAVVEALDDPELSTCFPDDMTLGWVYQYWNDPAREALDAKLHGGGKIEPHEIASKTQMFTERYMVDWTLQNSLGPMWRAMCRKHGWTPEVEADGTLDRLEARRVAWRARREAGEVSPSELMPLEDENEARWAYYVPQEIPADAVTQAPESLRDLKLLDPACGSGHFLVVALDLLVPLYREEARHRGVAEAPEWSNAAIVGHILASNLYGIDLDPRAVQIAAATLWLKARRLAPAMTEAAPAQLNLVAATLRLAGLPNDDPARVELRDTLRADVGLPAALTDRIVSALAGADHLGTLLRVDHAVSDAITAWGSERRVRPGALGDLFDPPPTDEVRAESIAWAKLDRALETFLQAHTRLDDLGLRLRGEQLAAGVRFVRMVREGQYDLVVGNPPYQGTAKLADAAYVQKQYPRGKADLYAAFLERGLQLARPGGVSALLTMRNWMFIKQYAALREGLLRECDLRALGDFAIGAFDEVPNDLLSVVVSVFRRVAPVDVVAVALQPTPPSENAYDRGRTARKRAATMCQVGRFVFKVAELGAVDETPVIYWWDEAFRKAYREAPKLGEVAPAAFGATTGDNARFVRFAHEVLTSPAAPGAVPRPAAWVPYVNGAKGRAWFEELRETILWRDAGLNYRTHCEDSVGANYRSPHLQFRRGIAFAMIGAQFLARAHRFSSVFGAKGSSVFPTEPAECVCAMNSSLSRTILNSLNPGLDFQVGDVNRLPLFPVANADDIFATLDTAFTEHESHREPSVEFRAPGPSAWISAQAWAQIAVDRPENTPLAPFTPDHIPEPPTDHLSFALGVALGRFGAAGEGILDPGSADLFHALPAGLLFLDGTLAETDTADGLGHPAAAPLHAAWAAHGAAIAPRADLRTYLRTAFFSDVHRKMYENRPIHWPLSSGSRTFVAWVNIHRMDEHTLRVLLADHLNPTLARLEGALSDLDGVRFGADAKAARAAERRHATLAAARDELRQFIADVSQCGEKGPPQLDTKCPAREVDARYAPDLDDGVMINSAALWPLLDPQWKDPRKWWRELAAAAGRKDYDWSHLAARYWPDRVDGKCKADASLGVAHGCFWRYHPARAWAWELRLQDELGPDFHIDEADSDGETGHRAAYLRDHPAEALDAVEKEVLRRRRKRKAHQPELHTPETGLWTQSPDLVWALEMRLAEKLGHDFRLIAPDEPAARATYEATHPDDVARRRDLIASLTPLMLPGGDAEDAAGDDGDDDAEIDDPDGDEADSGDD